MSKPEKTQEAIRLKKFRNAVGLKQEEFAIPLGILQGSYSDVERGKTSLTVSMIRKLIAEYKLNPYWFFMGEGSMFLPNSPETFSEVQEPQLVYGKSQDQIVELARRLDMMESQVASMRGENDALKKVISLLEKK